MTERKELVKELTFYKKNINEFIQLPLDKQKKFFNLLLDYEISIPDNIYHIYKKNHFNDIFKNHKNPEILSGAGHCIEEGINW